MDGRTNNTLYINVQAQVRHYKSSEFMSSDHKRLYVLIQIMISKLNRSIILFETKQILIFGTFSAIYRVLWVISEDIGTNQHIQWVLASYKESDTKIHRGENLKLTFVVP